MRISDWSSDVCSSDLNGRLEIEAGAIVTFSAKHDLGSSLARGGDLFQETFERALGRKRPEARRPLHGLAGLERARLARAALTEGHAQLIPDDDAPLRRHPALPSVDSAAGEHRGAPTHGGRAGAQD